jgi:hypothetical protein
MGKPKSLKFKKNLKRLIKLENRTQTVDGLQQLYSSENTLWIVLSAVLSIRSITVGYENWIGNQVPEPPYCKLIFAFYAKQDRYRPVSRLL